MYKILSNTLLPRLTPHEEEIVGYHQCGDMFPFKNGLNQGDFLSPLLFNFALE